MAEQGPAEGTTPIQVTQPSTGRSGTYYAPKGWTTTQIDAQLATMKAERVKSWGEYAYDHLVPKSPTEWAILGATAAPALLTGGGALLGSQALRGAATAIGGSALRRIGTTTAAGAVGAYFDPSLEKEPGPRRIGRGGTEGGVVGVGGELAAVPVTFLAKWAADKWIKTKSAEGLGRVLGNMDEILKNKGTPQDLMRVGVLDATPEAASQIYKKGIVDIVARNRGPIISPALTKAVEKMEMKDILPNPVAPGTHGYTAEAAFEILSEAGDFAFEAGIAKDTRTARSLIRLREQAFNDLDTHWRGTSLMTDFKKVNERYAVQQRGIELLKTNWKQVFPPGRPDLDTAQVTENLADMMATRGPTVRASLKGHLDELWRELGRGRDPGFRDQPGVSPSLRGGRMGYGRPSTFFGVGAPPYRTGATQALETAVPSTVETMGGTLMRQKQLKEIEQKSLEERIFGPRPVGGVPG